MSKMQMDMINQARKNYNQIYPCSSKSNFEECFTFVNGKCVFWFNTEDHSTHVIITELSAIAS